MARTYIGTIGAINSSNDLIVICLLLYSQQITYCNSCTKIKATVLET